MTINDALIQEITLNQNVSSVTIPVPSGYTDLRIVASVRTTNTLYGYPVRMYFNASTANGSMRTLRAYNGTTTQAYGNTYFAIIDNNRGNGATSNTFAHGEAYIANYASTNQTKTIQISAVSPTNAADGRVELSAGSWASSAAITSITFDGVLGAETWDFVAGSTFSVYGISALGTTPTQTPKATGGDIIKNDGTYWYHAFLSSGLFIPSTDISADVLVVAGGGGGGTSTAYNGAGGGGAGGVLSYGAVSLSSSNSCAVTIGAGGATNSNGSNSQFFTLDAPLGGGKGGSGNAVAGSTGGSGGGAGSNASGGAGTSGQGYAGGSSGYNSAGGGGGGSGAAASAVTGAGQGSNGGAGLNTWSSWLSATSLGVSGYIAGGGGGGSYTGYATAAGSAGGGNGGVAATGANAVVNTGSGGGAGGNAASGYAGGTGGSGVIIIKYAMA